MSHPTRSSLSRLSAGAALVVLTLAAFPVAAQQRTGYREDPKGKDELWDITSKMEMAGMPMAMPGQTHRVCMEKGNDEAAVPKQDGCTMVDSKRVGNRFTYRMVCKQGRNDYTADGDTSWSGNTYQGTMRISGRMDGEKADMKMSYSGTRVGNCVSTVRQDMAAAKADSDKQMAQMCAEALDRLHWQLYEPDNLCAPKRAEFSAAVAKVASEMRDPVQHVAHTRKSGDLKPVFVKYNQDWDATTKAACSKAVQTRNWSFVGSGNCDADVRDQGKTVCETRGKSPDPEFFPLCSRYVALTRGRGAPPGAADDAAAGAAAKPAPSAKDGVQQGIDAVRKLLPF